MSTVDKELLQFLKDWLAFAEGRKHSKVLSYGTGLCPNLVYYCINHEDADFGKGTLKRLKDIFVQDFKTATYPFGEVAYAEEYEQNSAHKNKARLKWVKNVINSLENGDDTVTGRTTSGFSRFLKRWLPGY